MSHCYYAQEEGGSCYCSAWSPSEVKIPSEPPGEGCGSRTHFLTLHEREQERHRRQKPHAAGAASQDSVAILRAGGPAGSPAAKQSL